MTDTATPETGPVDAPASIDDVIAEFHAGETDGEAKNLDAVTDELVNEAEGNSDSIAEPETEDETTEPGEVEAEPEESNPEEQIYTVKVNGEDREVPLTELLKGYSRTEDYKAKTTAVAEERRALEQQRTTLDTELRANYANQLEEATNLFAQFDPVLVEARQINWDALKATDPAAFVAAQDQVQTRLAQLEQMKQQVATARQQSQQQQSQIDQRSQLERFNASAEKIAEARPELADEAAFGEFAQANISFLKEAGFTREELADYLDHRVLTIADEARQWRAHKAAQATLPQKKIVPKSAVKALTTDGGGSRVSKPRMPNTSSRDKRAEWAVNRILEDL